MLTTSVNICHLKLKRRYILLSLLSLLNLMTLKVECEAFIKVTQFEVPPLVSAGSDVRLTCSYDIQNSTLSSMKLFKDDKEFYRFSPGNQQTKQSKVKQAFPVAGIQVDLKSSNSRDVLLIRVNKNSAGKFKCLVTIEEKFKSDSSERQMDINDVAWQAHGSNTFSMNGRQQQQRRAHLQQQQLQHQGTIQASSNSLNFLRRSSSNSSSSMKIQSYLSQFVNLIILVSFLSTIL